MKYCFMKHISLLSIIPYFILLQIFTYLCIYVHFIVFVYHVKSDFRKYMRVRIMCVFCLYIVRKVSTL